ncbi:MAG: hypothetical protein R2713_22780 [Ilumatobacteraceae bacterium]
MQGSDLLFGELVARLRWAQREVVMYDQLMLEPRLTAWWTTGSRSAEPAAVLAGARDALTHRYDKPFDSIGFNLYHTTATRWPGTPTASGSSTRIRWSRSSAWARRDRSRSGARAAARHRVGSSDTAICW